MGKNYKVLFLPDDITVEAPASTTILSAAAKAGVSINSLCGADGVCGRCSVIVQEGQASGGSTEIFTREEIQAGHILACQGRIESDMVVLVPVESRLEQAPKHSDDEVQLLSDLGKFAGSDVKKSPLVKKTCVSLSPPTLDDNTSDLQRLETGLKKETGSDNFQMGLKVTRTLPAVLRKADWKITAVTGYRQEVNEIIDVEAGDTTKRNFAIAADIGTTTVVCHLVDLTDGQTLERAAKYNSQTIYGADVIHRIIHASKGLDSEDALRKAIVDDLNQLIDELITKCHLGRSDITLISAAGNTSMIHLLLGLPAENIRKEPYTGTAYNLPAFRATELGLKINPRGLLYCLPCVAGFVGADIVSGIFATGLANSDQVRMLIDIGTNGEIVIGNKDFLVCASASAGPAFEGAECEKGMRATHGAIDHIRLLDANNVLNFSTIGSTPPRGICGTGFVDLIAEMLRVGLIDKTGHLDKNAAPELIKQGKDDQLAYIVIPANKTADNSDITITQADINNILRAKGAIYSAACVLLNALSMSFDDVTEILVAGAFGNFLNVGNAVFIGLLPDMPLDRIRFVGNASIAGAKLASISSDCYEEIFDIASRTTYFELSTDPTFMDQFVSACFFPHTDVDKFPSVVAELASRKGH